MSRISKINPGRYFEDFVLNEAIAHATPRTITNGERALYIAMTGNRNPLFCNARLAQSLGYADMPLHDLLVFHIAFGKTVPDISVNAVANLGYADVQFKQAVFAGDTLCTTSQVIGLKENSSGESGVVWVRSTTTNQHDEPVLSWVRWVMVKKNNRNAKAPETSLPTLPDYVPAAALSLPAYRTAQLAQTIQTASKGAYFWEDYQPNERIDHPAGMTINDSDHTLATHLYQNNARLHFDAQLMAASQHQQRLVYGGIIISICQALSYEGLENVTSLLAINAGHHVNPSFSGDTIYAITEVIDRWQVAHRPDIGLLRLRLVGVKNRRPEALAAIKTEGQYHADVVLDLDYTVVMPRKGSQS